MRPHIAELNRWLSVPHQWGVSDCLTLPADWVWRMTGHDPVADMRMTYGSAGEAQRAWRLFTHPLDSIGPRMAAIGLQVTAAPVVGDVGVVLFADGGAPRPHGAMCIGAKWALKTVDGSVLAIEGAKVLTAWGVGYCAG